MMPMRFGPGPVFTYEWLTTSRRWQVYAGRSLFVAALLAALAFVWIRMDNGRSIVSFQQLARVGETFFYAITGTQIALVLLAAPAATAGSICQEKANGTLTHLLTTDLSDVEIVLGKLAARFVPTAGLVLCALPVMALGTLLGGIDPMALTGALLVTLGVALLGASLALALSAWASRTYEVLLAVYSLWAVWLLAHPASKAVARAMGSFGWAGLGLIDPFTLAFMPYLKPGTAGLGGCLEFLGVCVMASAVLTVIAVRRVRVVAARQADRVGPGRGRSRAGTRVRSEGRWRPGPSLDWNPVLWREWHRNRPTRWARAIALAFAALATVFTLLAISDGLRGTRRGDFVPFVNAFQATIGLLMVAVVSATSLSEERTRGSLDVVLATPMRTSAIVLGKWWGGFRVVPPLAILPGLLATFLAWHHRGHWIGVPLIVGYILAYGAAIASLGLALATWLPRLGRVVGLTVVAHVIVAAGGFFLVVMSHSSGDFERHMAMIGPFFGVGALTAGIDGFDDSRWDSYVAWASLWCAFHLAVAGGLYVATLLTFDKCLGRVTDRPPVSDSDPGAHPASKPGHDRSRSLVGGSNAVLGGR